MNKNIILNTADIIVTDELNKKLNSGKQLIIKAGFDPTAPNLHLGHVILLKKLQQLQNLGHMIYFIVGDFTAMIGDPSGKSVTRPILTREQVLTNAKTYEKQVLKFLDADRMKIIFNSTWLSKLSLEKLIKLMSQLTVARVLERDDFQKRFQQNKSIALHEFLYPLLQAYDSVYIKADIEIGGTDQTFNLLMGRTLQKYYNLKQQTVITMPLLEGLDGVKKMSKSYNNSIEIQDLPQEIYGKVMSVSDDLMWKYLQLLNDKTIAEISILKQEVLAGKNPRDIKMQLAKNMVVMCHNSAQAELAEKDFTQKFTKGIVPDEMPEITLEIKNQLALAQALKMTNLVSSTSEAFRMIKQNAVKVNSVKINDIRYYLSADNYILQVGKRKFVKLHLIKVQHRSKE